MHKISSGPQVFGAEGQSCLTEATALFWALPLVSTGVRKKKTCTQVIHTIKCSYKLIKYTWVFSSFLPPWTFPALYSCVHFLPLICQIKLSKRVPVRQQPGKAFLNSWWFQTPRVSGCACEVLEQSIMVPTSQNSKGHWAVAAKAQVK